MNKKIFRSILVVSILSFGLMACAPSTIVEASTDPSRGPWGNPSVPPSTTDGSLAGHGAGQGMGAGMQANGSGIALSPLTAEERDGLIRAIEEEYAARALYESVIATFGDVIPFTEIAASEAQHATALVRQAQKYGLEVPAYAPADLPAFSTLAEACQAGVDAEIADAALYDELMGATPRTDLTRVYTNLQRASLNSHLPQFEACN